MSKLYKMLKKRCWEGYKPTPGVKAYEKGSCMKKDENLDKASKNVREQKKKIFGTSGNPGKTSPKTQAQMEALNQLAQKRYGVEVQPSGGKWDEEKGKRRKANPKIGVDKPDWRSGNIEAQQNPNAVAHELGHLEIMPEGVNAPEGQKLMDKQYSDVQKLHGYLKQKRSQHEIQPMAMENPLRRRAGLPATTEGMDVKPGTPERTAVDTGGPAAIRVPKGDKERDLIRQSRLMSPENRARMEDVDQGILQYSPKRGWGPAHTADAIINLRAQGRTEEAKQRLREKFNMAMRRKKKKASPTKLAASELEKADYNLKAKDKSKKGGLTEAGRKAYNRATGSNLKRPQPEGGPRKKSFCARFKGMKGPMKKPNGEPSRKALALRRWKC